MAHSRRVIARGLIRLMNDRMDAYDLIYIAATDASETDAPAFAKKCYAGIVAKSVKDRFKLNELVSSYNNELFIQFYESGACKKMPFSSFASLPTREVWNWYVERAMTSSWSQLNYKAIVQRKIWNSLDIGYDYDHEGNQVEVVIPSEVKDKFQTFKNFLFNELPAPVAPTFVHSEEVHRRITLPDVLAAATFDFDK